VGPTPRSRRVRDRNGPNTYPLRQHHRRRYRCGAVPWASALQVGHRDESGR